MKKKLTLILSLVLALSMCFCLVSCGEDTKGSSDDTSKVQSEEIKDGASTPALDAETSEITSGINEDTSSIQTSEVTSVEEVSIIGSWKGDIDYSEFYNTMINSMLGSILGDESAEYFDVKSFKLEALYTFNEDGTYTSLIDEDSVTDALESIKPDIKEGYSNYIKATIEAFELDMTVDEYLVLMETDLDSMAEQAIVEFDPSTFAENEEGTYKIEGDKVFTADDEDGEYDDGYMVFKLTADTLTFVDGEMPEDVIDDTDDDIDIGIDTDEMLATLMDSLFPMVFNRVK